MVELTVNRGRCTVDVAPETPLLSVLRNELGLCGVRTGCSIGECGVCTVVIDGEAVRSCLAPVGEAEGRAITTPEGLGGPDSPHPIQQAFLDEQAAQCGYCVNGMIMELAAVLDPPASLKENGPLGAEDLRRKLREALDEHLCRCGTHVRLMRAACHAAGLATDDETWALVPGETDSSAVTDGVDVGTASVDGRDEMVDRRVEAWIALGVDGRFEVRPGKVEIGQGVRAALVQIVAAHLEVPVSCVQMLATTTAGSPDQGYTARSQSVEDEGTALARAAVAFRRLLVERAAERLSAAGDQVELDAEGAACRSTGSRISYQELAAGGPLTGTVESTDRPQWDSVALGQPVPRDDLRRKLTGSPAYVQDLTLPGMLHARGLLPPSYDAWPEQLDVDDARQQAGVQQVVHDGRLVIVIAEREHQAMQAVSRLGRGVRWRHDAPPLDIPDRDVHALLRQLPSQPFVARPDPAAGRHLDPTVDEDPAVDDRTVDEDPAADRRLDRTDDGGDVRHRATFTKPYEAHAPMAPSAAVAFDDGDRLHVWSHTQGVYPLRRELATLLGRDEQRITVEHVAGPGCYGMDGADDAAALAAVAARAVPGRPVRLQLSMEDELGWDPYGPAMLADLDASLDHEGRIATWRHHVVTDAHGPRPDGTGDRLLASWLRADGVPRPWAGPGEPGARNAVPPYDIPAIDVVAHHVRGPLRTGPLRSLGAYMNVFATESFMDELAEQAEQDPLAFRLAHLTDERARRVLEVVAEQAGWEPHVGPSGRGQGIAFARYKDTKAYVAQVAEVDVDVETGELVVRRLDCAADAGTIVNADGLRNQLEGGTIQGLSRAMHEELGLGEHGVTIRDWTSYPVIRFRHVPRIEVVMVDRRGSPPLGAGESATPPVPAAVANAIDDAVGIRLRDLPLTPTRLRQRLYDMDDQEMARVRL